MPSIEAPITAQTARRRWMSVLALATPDEVEGAWRQLEHRPAYVCLRGPEVGLVMVRARAGGTGLRFNVGETTVTRCSVQTAGGTLGHAWVHGRQPRHAELAAALDAMLQDPAQHPALQRTLIEPLARARDERRRAVRERAAETRVEFFTMVRGDD
jgi:alpha-D-ribose 1-methylphosphonate 5-triphosphate synthase subunit PhnG